MNKQEKSISYFKNKFNCAQSVFTTFGPDFGISEDTCLKISTAFGSGMGKQQLTCGAVTGALMALGLKFGKALHDDDAKKRETYEKTIEFISEFKKLQGSVNCRELLNGLDMTKDEDMKQIHEQRLFETKCRKCVEDAVMIAEKIMHT